MKYLLVLFIILCLFFRIYKLEEFFLFEHDQDLISWIVKDILVDHHPRLIGQLTSIDGVFIGPIFYYLMVPFYALFKMNPVSAVIPVLIISTFTVISIYFVFSRIFTKKAGLIGSFIYAVSVGSAFGDRWIVPTQPTLLWCVWYLYVLLKIANGDLRVLPVLGILLGLVWHIHIALIALVVLIPIAIFMSGKKIKIADCLFPAVFFIILTSPFWLFEAKYNFQQIRGFINSISEERGEFKGINRIEKIYNVASDAFILPILETPKFPPTIIYLSFFSVFVILIFKRIIKNKYAVIITSWLAIVFISQSISKRPISEYYFSNFNVITILIYTLFVAALFEKWKRKLLASFLILIYFLINIITIIKIPVYQNGYAERKKVVAYIKSDAQDKKYPCIGINYIADLGAGVGFRYLFWFNNVKLINAGTDVPVYNIVIPYQYAGSEVNFGIFGVIKPKVKEFANTDICNNPNKQLLPLLGFTN